MRLLYDWFFSSFKDNIAQCASWNLCGNLTFGLAISCIVCFCLLREARGNGSYYSFSKKEILPVSFSLTLTMVLMAPPFPRRGLPVVGIFAMASCFTVFGITSVTDRKNGHFTAGYMMVGLFLSVIWFLVRLKYLLHTADKADWVPFFICIGTNLLLGTFAYRFGDALLFLMGQVTIVVCMEPYQWMLSLLVSFMVSMVTYVGENMFFLRQIVTDKNTRFPFTLNLFIGVLASFFMMR